MWKDSRKFNSDLGSRFFQEEIDRKFADAEEMMNRMFATFNETKLDRNKGSYFYGCQITVGPDGKPRVREFGNVRPTNGLLEKSGTREPLVDSIINEKQNQLIITAEMPGVTKQDIKVSITENSVTIHAEKNDKKYHTEIPASLAIDANKPAKANYSNGILELKIALKERVNRNQGR